MRQVKNIGLAALKKENLKLQQRIVNLEAQLVTARNRISALEKERSAGLEKYSEEEPSKRLFGNLSDAEKLKRINELDRRLKRQPGRK
jgi:predicted  nucleic acid-binding Zn-ribbon protein